MDISVFVAVCRELAQKLPGARIVDMSEGGAGELCITLKRGGERLELLVCPRPDMPRIYLATGKYCRARSLTPSAQAIRNNINGRTVALVTQEGLERVVVIGLEKTVKAEVDRSCIVYEMAGKKPNLIVLDGDGKVAVAQTYTPISDDSLRPLLPGMKYMPPPLPDKLDPLAVEVRDIGSALDAYPAGRADKALFMRIGGISPMLAREAVALAGGGADADALKAALDAVTDKVLHGPYSPRVIMTDRGPVPAAFALKQYEGTPFDIYGTMSEAAEACYRIAAEIKLFDETKRRMTHEAGRMLNAARRRLAALEGDLDRTRSAQVYTKYANLLMAQLNSVPEGSEEAELPDLFSDERETVSIPLDPGLSAVKNAERYFRMARKAVAGERLVRKRHESTLAEIASCEELMAAIEQARDMEGLAKIEGGPDRRPSRGAKTGQPQRFPGFISSDGYEVLYAKNAKKNDELTFKLAEPMDLWFHAQGYHGAHVLVRNPKRRPDIPLSTILEAAAAAAWLSDARREGSVAVDYTFKKYVRKPRDPASGQAVFTQNKTVFVRPERPGADG